jgi:ATP-dependent Lon protease
MNEHEQSLKTESLKTAEETASSENAAELAETAFPELPDDAVILLPTRNAVMFPGVVAPLMVGRPQTVAGAQAAAQGGKRVGILLQSDPAADAPGPDQLHGVGTITSWCAA